jgi:hypothetical protein
MSHMYGAFLEETQTKALRVFLLAIYSHLDSFALSEMSISSNSCNLLRISRFQLLYTVKEKGGKPNRKPFPLPYGLRNP